VGVLGVFFLLAIFIPEAQPHTISAGFALPLQGLPAWAAMEPASHKACADTVTVCQVAEVSMLHGHLPAFGFPAGLLVVGGDGPR